MNTSIQENINTIKILTGNSPDIIYKDILINKKTVAIIYSKCVCDEESINDFILRRIDEEKNNIKAKDMITYFKSYIPNCNALLIDDINQLLYYIASGFTALLIDKQNKCLVFENKAKLDSGVLKSQVEKSVKGPLDALTENYSINIGMIRKRIKDPNLWLEEKEIGTESKCKTAMFYINGKVKQHLLDKIRVKLDQIDVKYIGDSNFIVEAISKTNRTAMPTVVTTERPDYICEFLMEGRVVILCENSNTAIILPSFFVDFFKAPDDFHQKPLNVFTSRLIRIIAFLIAVILPALYIAVMAYNWEILPSGLLINFSVQRDGVPFSSVLEVLLMGSMFQILRESDIRFPGSSGSSLSIVGAIVLGQAAVEAGVVSPITIIIVGISEVASLAFNSIEMIGTIRIWELFLIVLSSLFGMIGLVFGVLILTSKLAAISSCGESYLFPIEPFNSVGLKSALAITKNYILHPFNANKGVSNNEKKN